MNLLVRLISIGLILGLVNAYYPYSSRWWPRRHPRLSRGDRQWIIQREERQEMPILNPRHLDENLVMICDTGMTPDDIYTGLTSVLVRIEDTLRSRRCSRRRFHYHKHPMHIRTLFGKLNKWPVSDVRRHPVHGTFLDTMAQRTRQLIHKAKHCELDYVLLMKVIRMSMKLLVNDVMCGFVEIDKLRNRLGWSSKYGTRHHKKRRPYYRWPRHHRHHRHHHRHHHHHHHHRHPRYHRPSYPNYSPYSPIYSPSTLPYYLPTIPDRWPYTPYGPEPSNPYLGPINGGGRQLNGYDSGCPDCDKNRNVILAPYNYQNAILAPYN